MNYNQPINSRRLLYGNEFNRSVLE